LGNYYKSLFLNCCLIRLEHHHHMICEFWRPEGLGNYYLMFQSHFESFDYMETHPHILHYWGGTQRILTKHSYAYTKHLLSLDCAKWRTTFRIEEEEEEFPNIPGLINPYKFEETYDDLIIIVFQYSLSPSEKICLATPWRGCANLFICYGLLQCTHLKPNFSCSFPILLHSPIQPVYLVIPSSHIISTGKCQTHALSFCLQNFLQWMQP
jgi:hypothetical protein